MDPLSVKRRLTCILAADAVGYSKQMGEDEEGTIRVLSAHRAVIDGIVTVHQGRIVSTAGDSVLAEFASVVEAVRCAVEIQEALKTRNDSLPGHRQMHFRVGVNLGDVVVKDDDLLGDGVNVAARLETMAEPGGICISSSVYDQITGKLDLGFEDIGEQSLKNISRPIRVYRVSGAAPPLRPAPPVLPPAPSAVTAPSARSPLPWALGIAVAAVIGAAVAWQGGWIGSGSTDSSSRTIDAAAATASERSAAARAVVDASALRTQAESDAQRLRSEAEAIKRQADAELARARSDAEAAKAAWTKREAQAAKSAQPQPAAAAKAGDSASSPSAAVASDKGPSASPGSVARFDGAWSVIVDCPKHSDGALGYTLEFIAQVKNGVLQGEHGTEGNANWLRLQGDIQPDGSAKLDAKGLTGDPRYNVKSVQRGVPYAYQVDARFDGSRGTGRRLQLRACDLTFTRR
jgi:class 3 adenylate cyclase